MTNLQGTNDIRGKQIEEELYLARREWEEIFQAIGQPTLILDSEHRMVEINRAALDLLGRSKTELLGRKCYEIFHLTSAPPRGCPAETLFSSGGKETLQLEMEALGRIFLVACTPMLDPQGRVQKIIHIATDITGRKQAEHALRRSEENYRLLVNNLPAIVSQGYADGSVDFFDDKIEVLTGYSREEFISRKLKWLDIVFPQDLPQMRRAFLQGLKGDGFYVREYRLRAKDGRTVWIRERSQIVLNQAGQVDYISGVVFDITEQKQEEEARLHLEAQLRQAQKMEAIGTLAGGIAHDFNNILSAILGYTELALLALEQPAPAVSELRDHLEDALRAGGRARDLVTQILTFSRRTEPQRKPVQVYSVIKETLKFLRSSMPATIEIRQHLDPHCGIVLADPVQVHQVVLNLGTNAYHAMYDQGGVLEVELAGVTVDEELARLHPELHPGPYVCIKVRDNGRGMDHSTLERVFDPFFTTKKAGEGTGLGLSVVHGAVASLGGAILVDSELGKGTTFQVYLPRHREAAIPERPKAEPIPAGREHVLFVDDEPQISDIARRLLEHLGYQVTAFSNSLEALDEFKAEPQKFDLVVTDLTMPNLTGVELAREMLKLRPALPIILTSGFSDSITPERARNMGIREYLMKPMAFRQLGEAIRRVLDKQSASREP